MLLIKDIIVMVGENPCSLYSFVNLFIYSVISGGIRIPFHQKYSLHQALDSNQKINSATDQNL